MNVRDAKEHEVEVLANGMRRYSPAESGARTVVCRGERDLHPADVLEFDVLCSRVLLL